MHGPGDKGVVSRALTTGDGTTFVGGGRLDLFGGDEVEVWALGPGVLLWGLGDGPREGAVDLHCPVGWVIVGADQGKVGFGVRETVGTVVGADVGSEVGVEVGDVVGPVGAAVGACSNTSKKSGNATELPPAERSKRLCKLCGELVRPGKVATTTSTSSPGAMLAGAVMLKTMRNKADAAFTRRPSDT